MKCLQSVRSIAILIANPRLEFGSSPPLTDRHSPQASIPQSRIKPSFKDYQQRLSAQVIQAKSAALDSPPSTHHQ
jgi:hypothetical protein